MAAEPGKAVHNERVKLLAGAFNNIGLAFIIGGFIAPVVAGQITVGRVLLGVLWSVVGGVLHAFAQLFLGRLKE